MKNKSPLTKDTILKDCKDNAIISKIVLFFGLFMLVLGIAMLFVLLPLSLAFIAAFCFLLYLSLKMQKKNKDVLRSIQNDNFLVIEDRILEKEHKVTSYKDKDGDLDYKDSYFIVGIKTEEKFFISEDEYEELKIGDFFYYGCINHDSFTSKFLASEWYIDSSLQPLFVPWSNNDEEIFVKKQLK